MSFYNQIQPFIEYLESIRKVETYISFDMKFPVKWTISKNVVEEGKVIPFESGDPNLKGISFVSKIDSSEIDTTLAKVLKVIKINKEREIKEKLFKETIERLRTTFEKNDLSTLKNLYFDFQIETKNDENIGESENIELAE